MAPTCKLCFLHSFGAEMGRASSGPPELLSRRTARMSTPDAFAQSREGDTRQCPAAHYPPLAFPERRLHPDDVQISSSLQTLSTDDRNACPPRRGLRMGSQHTFFPPGCGEKEAFQHLPSRKPCSLWLSPSTQALLVAGRQICCFLFVKH